MKAYSLLIVIMMMPLMGFSATMDQPAAGVAVSNPEASPVVADYTAAIEHYYHLTEKEDYAGLFNLFAPKASVLIETDFGIWFPAQKVEFIVESVEQFQWNDDEEAGEDMMAGYKVLNKKRTIEEPQASGAGKKVKVVTIESYDWQGEKGEIETVEWFYFLGQQAPLKIHKLVSKSQF